MFNSSCQCTTSMVGKVLVVVGALNWGLVGLGSFFGGANWNLVSMLLGSMPTVENVVYVLVGIAGVVMAVGCKCSKCSSCSCVADSSKSM